MHPDLKPSYQGDTVTFTVNSNSEIDLTAYDIQIRLYQSPEKVYVLTKEENAVPAPGIPGAYLFTLAPQTTAVMAPGFYFLEVYLSLNALTKKVLKVVGLWLCSSESRLEVTGVPYGE